MEVGSLQKEFWDHTTKSASRSAYHSPREVFIMGSGKADLSLLPLLTGNEFSVTRQWRHPLHQVNCVSRLVYNTSGMQYSSLEFAYFLNAFIMIMYSKLAVTSTYVCRHKPIIAKLIILQ
jgi:hypothetical protein